MEHISAFLRPTPPVRVINTGETLRTQSLLLIIFAALGVLIAIINFSASPFHNIIAGVFFLVSSLVGVFVGILGFDASKKYKTKHSGRYKKAILTYSVFFIACTVVTVTLEFITILDFYNSTTEEIIFGVILFSLLVVTVPVCLWCVKTSKKFHLLVSNYEEHPYTNGEYVDPEDLTKYGSSLMSSSKT
mmetsp:Transcript_12677/g.18496  ORF Transcript_12677/g.18496 Transcript_12677/m.18496 type:complete len:189 (+) Transcript_12677:6-572(+)